MCSLCYALRPPLATSLESDALIAKCMMALARSLNKLQQKVTDNKWGLKVHHLKTMNVTAMPDFPQLNEFELTDLTMGVNQIFRAKTYSKDHQMKPVNTKTFSTKNKMVFSGPIRSRHTSSRTYNLWIEHSTSLNPINDWFCTCKSGTSVVGCCAHIASVLWYLSFERQKKNI